MPWGLKCYEQVLPHPLALATGVAVVAIAAGQRAPGDVFSLPGFEFTGGGDFHVQADLGGLVEGPTAELAFQLCLQESLGGKFWSQGGDQRPAGVHPPAIGVRTGEAEKLQVGLSRHGQRIRSRPRPFNVD